MAILTIRPDRLSRLVPSTEGYEDALGGWHPGSERWEGDHPCDAVTGGKAVERRFEDGVVRAYTYEVTLGTDVPDLRVGDRVRIRFFGGGERAFEVKGFDRKQYQCKLWV